MSEQTGTPDVIVCYGRLTLPVPIQIKRCRGL
jgi:hypothetical protein